MLHLTVPANARPLLDRVAAVIALVAAVWALPASAQQWPTRYVTFIVAGSAGSAPDVVARIMANDLSQRGDYFSILIENNGAGGFYTEIGRTCVFGGASPRMREELAFTLTAQRFSLDLLVPGAAPAEVLARYNDFMRLNQHPPEDRLHCHSQGYDLVERPLATGAEPIPIAASMNMACHPTYVLSDGFYWICDNFLVSEHGCERLHQTPQDIFEI